MKILKNFKYCLILLTFFLGASCEEDLQEFELLTTVPCTETNVVVDPFIISDFECQNNVAISDVTVVRNPTETGINTSLFVGQYTDGPSGNDALEINYGEGIDLTENGLLQFKVNSQITGEIVVQLQGDDNDDDDSAVLSSTVFGGDGWSQFEFDFSEFEDFDFSQILIIFNAGVETNGEDIYFIDDIRFLPTIDPCEDVEPDESIISDFECQQNYFLGDPAQGETAVPVVANPSVSGINTSAFVGEYTDNGTEPFDNLLIDFGDPIDLSENAQLSLKIRSDMEISVIAKLEGGTEDIERNEVLTQTNQWTELTFDFTAAQGVGSTRLILFFNAGSTDGTENDIYFIDDLRFVPFQEACEGVTPDNSIISDFECQQNYALDNVPLVDNPNPNNINMSSTVGQYTDNGTEPFDSLIIDLGGPFDLSENAQFNIKVLSPLQAPLLAKLEGGDEPLEITTQMEVVGEWQNYSFDFTDAIEDGNTTLVLFFNAGQDTGTLEDIYFIDDLRFSNVECAEIIEDCEDVEQDLSIINDFDCQQNYDFSDPNAAPIVQNPNVSCENRSSNVGEYTDNGTIAFDFLLVNYGTPIDLSVNNQLKIKILSSMAVPLLAKLEGGEAVEIGTDINVVGEWMEYTFDFSGAQDNGNTTLVLFFNAGSEGGTAADIYYIDDLRFEPQ